MLISEDALNMCRTEVEFSGGLATNISLPKLEDILITDFDENQEVLSRL